MSATANFAAAPRYGSAHIDTANINRNGTGAMGSPFVTGANGSRIDDVMIKASGATTAGMIRFFIHDGTNTRFITEVQVTAATPSATTKSFEAGITIGESFPTGHTLKASTHNAEGFDISVFGGDF